MMLHILLLDRKNCSYLHSTGHTPENTHNGPTVQRKIFDTDQGAVEFGSLLQTPKNDSIALLKTPKLLATSPMPIAPALGLARWRAIPRKSACLALEQDGQIGSFGSFAAAEVSTNGAKERHAIRRLVKDR